MIANTLKVHDFKWQLYWKEVLAYIILYIGRLQKCIVRVHPHWLWAASGTGFAKCKRFLRFFQNAYFPSTEFMGAHFFSPVWFLTRTLLQSRAWILILRKWQCKFQCKGLPLQFRTHNVYTSILLSKTVHTIYILWHVANVCIFIENCSFRSSRPVVDGHNGNFL